MRFRRSSIALPSLLLSLVGTASAHPITVDGVADEWLARQPNAADLGMIARDSTGKGEFIWRDAVGDARTDLAGQNDPAADMSAFAVTGDDVNLYFVVRLPIHNGASPAQVQIAIDTAPGGVGSFLTGSETNLAVGMGAEFLVRTLFANNSPSDAGAIVYNAQGQSLATVPAERGADGIEISVPWTLLGFLAGPPSSMVRLSVAIFRAQTATTTVEVTGPDALDALTDYGNPRAAAVASPGTASEFPTAGDARVDDYVDVFFRPDGDVYAPVVISRFVSSSTAGQAGQWLALRNVSPVARSSGSLKVGDSEAPDDGEGMAAIPPGINIQPGSEIVVAASGTAYDNYFIDPPNYETSGNSASVPDALPDTVWSNTAMGPLTNGDEYVLLDSSNTILDMATWGLASYPGITSMTPAPGAFMVASRNATFTDTDNCDVDFTLLGAQCAISATCETCYTCGAQDACVPSAAGTNCGDDTVCNGADTCDGAGECISTPAPNCNDNDPCTSDSCHFATGCFHGSAGAGTSCNDGNTCTMNDGCDGSGECTGTPLDCNQAPFPECISANVSRKYVGGMCLGGGCMYQGSDSICENGCDEESGLCNDDPCAGIDCSNPPPCRIWSGTCIASACLFVPADLACDDGNACTALDSCDGSGSCGGVPVQCNTPPASSCTNATTSRVYFAAGNCNAGSCIYSFQDTDCGTTCNAQTGLCEDDPCATVGCSTPPGQCYLAIGSCQDGICSYDPQARGAICDDGDPCTTNDACTGAGNCVGAVDLNCGAGGTTGAGGTASGGNGGNGGNGGAAAGMGGAAAGTGAASGMGGNAGTTGGTSNAAGEGGDGTAGSAGTSSEAGAPGSGGTPSAGGTPSTGGASSTGGSSQSGGSDSGDAGAGTGAGSGDVANSGDDGGCGCSIPGEERSSHSPLLSLLLLAFAFAFARRTARKASRLQSLEH